jgi:sterol desaturase/sphingolipid hydroxylase (fatty acid hydroxylase superfamily)
MAIGNALPLYLPVDWMAAHRWIDGTRFGVVGGAIIGFVVLELFVYGWHRANHTFSPLWRASHQIHHSPLRVDIPGSVVFHPVEIVIYTLIPLFVTVIVLGLDPLAAALTGYAFTLASYFQHWNVHTPQWMGYILQRPESHCVHHRKGSHYYNFADLPLWDIVFGTFRNRQSTWGSAASRPAPTCASARCSRSRTSTRRLTVRATSACGRASAISCVRARLRADPPAAAGAGRMAAFGVAG